MMGLPAMPRRPKRKRGLPLSSSNLDAPAHAQTFDRLLANDGHDTRSLARYLGHRNLQSAAPYTALAPASFCKVLARRMDKMTMLRAVNSGDNLENGHRQ
jgi:hypothetical protein